MSIKFLETAVPMSYKLHVNSYLTAIRKKQLDVVASQSAETPVQQKTETPAPAPDAGQVPPQPATT